PYGHRRGNLRGFGVLLPGGPDLSAQDERVRGRAAKRKFPLCSSPSLYITASAWRRGGAQNLVLILGLGRRDGCRGLVGGLSAGGWASGNQISPQIWGNDHAGAVVNRTPVRKGEQGVI